MSKDWQPNRNPSNDFPGANNRSKSKPEGDKSSIYGNSLGYGSSLGYGNSLGYGSSLGYTPGLGYGPSLESRPSPEGIAQAKKSTGNPHTLDWNRVTTESSQKLTTPANGGESLVNQDFNNNLAVNSKNTSSANKQLDSNSQDIQLASTSLIPGVGYRIEAPPLNFEDPNFQFWLAVKTLVDIFGFDQNDAHHLIYDLLTKKIPIGIYGVGIIYGSKGPNGRPMIQMSVESKMVTYYRDMAPRLKQQRSNQQNNQRIQNEQREKRRSELRNSYVNALKKYTNDVRLKIRAFIAQLDKDDQAFLAREAQDIYRRIATNSNDTELAEAIRIEVAYNHFRDRLLNFVRGPAPNQQQPSRQPQQQQPSRQPQQQQPPRQPQQQQPPRQPQQQQPPRQPQQQQPPRQPPNHNDRTEWQATAQAFNQRFGANYSREQIIAIQQLVGATPDGSYGEETARKVYLWQQNNKIPNPDGLVGDVTWGAMVPRLPRTRTDVAPAESSNANNTPPPTSQVAGTRTQSNTVPVRDSSSNAGKAASGERANFSNLNEEINLYETALFQEIPQISARVQAGLNSQVFSQATVTAWHRLSELMIHLYPAAKASKVDPKLSGAIVDAGNQLFESLQKTNEAPTRADGSPSLRRFSQPAQAGAGRKIAELVAQNNWKGLYEQYYDLAATLDSRLQEDGKYRGNDEAQVKADRAGAQRLEYIRGMGQQLQQFKTESAGTNPARLTADFYPQEKASEGSSNPLEKIPLSLYVRQQEDKWILTQITPKTAIDVSVSKKPEETNPPHELFEKLNSSNRFPKGTIRYLLPDGTAGMVEVDGKWKLSDWLAWIGLGAGLAALTIFTLGSGTVLVSTIGYPLFYLGAGAQVGSSVANIYERNRDGTINPMQVSLDAVNIVSAVTGAGAATAGRFVLDASDVATAGNPYRGMMARLANFADGWFVPLTGANMAADGATVALMTADAFRQSQEIWAGAGEDGDKRKAMALLIAQLAVTGSLTTLSIKGNIADLRSGRMLVLDIVDGVPVARSTRGTGEGNSSVSPGSGDFNNTRTDLSDRELDDYINAVDNWEDLKKRVIHQANNKLLMEQFTRYRQRVFEELEAEIKKKFSVEGRFVEKGDGTFKSIIAGSTQLSSDYDATFVSPVGDKGVELEAVIEFNRLFRQRFGKESGTVFDTNVYTSGHTLSSAMGDRLNEVLAWRQLEELLKLPDDLQVARKKLTTLVGRARKEQEDKISKMEDTLGQREQKIREKVNEINDLKKTDPNNSEPELQIDNIDDPKLVEKIQEQTESATTRYQQELSQEKKQNSISHAGEAQLAADRDVMALLKQRRYMTDEEWTGSYQNQVLDGITDLNVKAATAARFKKADEVYKNATQELHEKIVELNRNKPPEKQVRDRNGSPETDALKIMENNSDAQLEAFNRLYERYLKGSQNIRIQLEEFQAMKSGKTQSTLSEQELTNKIDELTIELNEIQSKALFFANEAYHTRAAVEHVVLGQQLGLKVPLETDERLISINEQFGFAMHIVTSDAGLGKAFWKSAKYIDRVNDAIKTIKDANKENPNLFTPETIRNIDRMLALFDELVLIKKEKGKYYEMGDDEKTTEAIAVAREKGFNITNTADLRKQLLEYSAQVNSQIRNALSAKYRTNPSSLNNQPVDTNLHSSRTLHPRSELLAKSSAKNLELAEFG